MRDTRCLIDLYVGIRLGAKTSDAGGIYMVYRPCILGLLLNELFSAERLETTLLLAG